jgi:hypothetical protein
MPSSTSIDLARLALHVVGHDGGAVAAALRLGGGAGQRVAPGGDDPQGRPREAGIAGLRRLRHLSREARVQVRLDGRRRLHPPAPERLQRVGEGGGVRYGGAGGDHVRRAADYIGDGERHHRGGCRGAGEPPAPDGREMLADGVQVADGCARLHQRARDRPQFGELHPRRRRGPVIIDCHTHLNRYEDGEPAPSRSATARSRPRWRGTASATRWCSPPTR